jgi:hypothetical protein
MSVLLNVENELADYATAMPDCGMAEDLDFEVWGREFCKWIVSSFIYGSHICVIDELFLGHLR